MECGKPFIYVSFVYDTKLMHIKYKIFLNFIKIENVNEQKNCAKNCN